MNMATRSHVAILALAGALVSGSHTSSAQGLAQQPSQGLPTEIPQIRFNSGQAVVPYYEGWIKNGDGTFDLVFGYFNRNFKEELAIPPGSDNKVEPGPTDQGQPTYFMPRRRRWVFRTRVPANFGKGIVTWSITANGKTEKAYGDLMAAQEITERVVMTNGNFDPGLNDPNQPPEITLAPVSTASVGVPITLTAMVKDDGLPKPRVPRATPPPTTPGGFGAQVNSSNTGRPRGLTVSWLEYRGPAAVRFEPESPIPVSNGQAITTARFTAPGTYKLVGSAGDGALTRKAELTITVRAEPTQSGR